GGDGPARLVHGEAAVVLDVGPYQAEELVVEVLAEAGGLGSGRLDQVVGRDRPQLVAHGDGRYRRPHRPLRAITPLRGSAREVFGSGGRRAARWRWGRRLGPRGGLDGRARPLRPRPRRP